MTLDHERTEMSDETMKRVIKFLWREVAAITNPWLTAVTSGLPDYRERWERWNQQQVKLMQDMFDVVFDKTPPTEALILSALTLLDGAASCPEHRGAAAGGNASGRLECTVMTTLDPTLCARLVSEAREDDSALCASAPVCDCAGSTDVNGTWTHKYRCASNLWRMAGARAAARTHINLRALADQLEAALAEVKRLYTLSIEQGERAILAEQENAKLRKVVKTALIMRRNPEGCMTDPRCERCFRCDFDNAVDALEPKP
jgi:hypothetical protein